MGKIENFEVLKFFITKVKIRFVIGGFFRASSVIGWRPERSFMSSCVSVCSLLEIKHIQRSVPIMKLPFGSGSLQLSVLGQRKQ